MNRWRSGSYYIGGITSSCPSGRGKFVLVNGDSFEGDFECDGLLTSSVQCGMLRVATGRSYAARLLPVYFTLYQLVQIELLEDPYSLLEANLLTDGILRKVKRFSQDVLTLHTGGL